MAAKRRHVDSRIVVIEIELDGESDPYRHPHRQGSRSDHAGAVLSEPRLCVGMRWRPDYIQRLAKREGDFIILPDLPAIFSSQREAHAVLGASHRQ
jgi:purine-binding chemotaxis protein CheW